MTSAYRAHSTSHRERWMFLIGLGVALGVLLIARLIDVQLVRGQTFFAQAERNRLHSFVQYPQRGVFLDRYGEPLVWNQLRYGQVSTQNQLYQQTTPISNEEALRLMATDSSQVVAYPTRLYRYPRALAHVLGYVGIVTAEDLQAQPQLTSEELVGKTGLEREREAEVHGVLGNTEFEVNALGKKQRPVAEQPAVAGENQQSTLDPYLSEVALRALGTKRGSVVIADVETGEVLSIVNNPSYDPNILTNKGLTPEAEAARQQSVALLFSDATKPFFNRAVSGSYPPGSVFKLVSALAGLESGAVDANTVVLDEGVLKVGEYQYGNWYFRQYGRTEGPVTLTKALSRSNDIYFYKLAEWTGPTAIATTARLFGLGSPVGTELSGEAKGLVPDPAWKEAVTGERWYLGNTYHYGIGQGDLLVSPLQITQMVQAFGNGGTLCRLHFLFREGSDCKELGVKAENVALVLKGMLDACSSGGTGFPFFAYNASRRIEGATPAEDFNRGAVACKTGTAEFGAADERGYRPTHGWFVALVGIDGGRLSADVPPATATAAASLTSNLSAELVASAGAELRQKWLSRLDKKAFPRELAIVVLVESDETNVYKEGSRDAGPVAREIVRWITGE